MTDICLSHCGSCRCLPQRQHRLLKELTCHSHLPFQPSFQLGNYCWPGLGSPHVPCQPPQSMVPRDTGLSSVLPSPLCTLLLPEHQLNTTPLSYIVGTMQAPQRSGRCRNWVITQLRDSKLWKVLGEKKKERHLGSVHWSPGMASRQGSPWGKCYCN